jgi:Tfp pilus assembly protein FimT
MPDFASIHALPATKPRYPHVRAACAGSSLLEFMVSMTIATGLAFISVPQFNSITDGRFFSKKCQALRPALELGRVSALALGHSVEVSIEDTRIVGVVAEQKMVVFRTDLPEGRAEIASSEPGKVLFRANLSSTPSSIRIIGSSRLCHIRISLRGRVLASTL